MADPAAAGSDAVVPAGGSEDWTPSFGDMVWGKVKSHPWWPGHVYSISLSDDLEVHRGHRHGLVLVAFFGDDSYGWFEPHELVRFEDHFMEKTSQGGSRTFPAAIAESLDEIARRSALALLCPCRVPGAFRPHNEDPGILLVNVPGFDSSAEYLPDQVMAARERFVPKTMLDYLQSAAVEQRDAAEKRQPHGLCQGSRWPRCSWRTADPDSRSTTSPMPNHLGWSQRRLSKARLRPRLNELNESHGQSVGAASSGSSCTAAFSSNFGAPQAYNPNSVAATSTDFPSTLSLQPEFSSSDLQ